MKAQNETQNPHSDIIHAHYKIQKHFKEENAKLPDYVIRIREKLLYFLSLTPPYGFNSSWIKIARELLAKYNVSSPVKQRDIVVKLKEYKEILKEIETLDKRCDSIQYQDSIYTFKSKDIIDKYKEQILTPIKSNFLKSESKTTSSRSECDQIVSEYRQLLEECFEKDFIELMFPKMVKCSSLDLTNVKEENQEDASVAQDDDSVGNISTMVYDDLSRISFNQKYKYEKRLHFKDIIMQYQGLQHKTIPKEVYDDVEDMIKKHNITKDTLTKEQLKGFLIESKRNKFYEDLHLIYHNITSKNLPNIQKYEKRLFDDFEQLVDAFLKLDNIDRKNFLNGHYVLRQLLKRHGYIVPEGDLNSLKTLSRMREHDEIYQRCCDILSWSFSPMC
jgi:hypothetical protein